MKKLLSFAGGLALAVAFGLAGAANAGRPEGVGGGPRGGGPTQSVSQFSSPFVNCANGSVPCDPIGEVRESVGRINNLGDWKVMTSGLGAGPYDICLDAESAPALSLPLPHHLGILAVGAVGALDAEGNIGANGKGDWRGLSFQIYKYNSGSCDGALVQESGITLTENATWFSEFSSPFVNVDGEVTDSTGQIRNDGFWYVLTGDLGRQIKKYAVCVDAVVPVYTPFLLADRDSEKKGTFFASGNMVERYGLVGDWVGLSLQIDVQEGSACTVYHLFEQESGITIR